MDKQLFNKWTLLGSLAVTVFLCIMAVAGMLWLRPTSGQDFEPAPAILTIVPAPTGTPRAIPAATIDPALAPTPTPDPSQIAIDRYVQIAGTDGDGLRLRDQPGLNTTPLFLGYDSEVFIVSDGPRQADGFTWWYLVAPYDNSRAGWAAAQFLALIP